MIYWEVVTHSCCGVPLSHVLHISESRHIYRCVTSSNYFCVWFVAHLSYIEVVTHWYAEFEWVICRTSASRITHIDAVRLWLFIYVVRGSVIIMKFVTYSFVESGRGMSHASSNLCTCIDASRLITIHMCGSWLACRIQRSWRIDMLSFTESCAAHQRVSSHISMRHVSCLFVCVVRGSLIIYWECQCGLWMSHVPQVSKDALQIPMCHVTQLFICVVRGSLVMHGVRDSSVWGVWDSIVCANTDSTLGMLPPCVSIHTHTQSHTHTHKHPLVYMRTRMHTLKSICIASTYILLPARVSI